MRGIGDCGVAGSDGVVHQDGGLRGADLRANGQRQGLLLRGDPQEYVRLAGVSGARRIHPVVWLADIDLFTYTYCLYDFIKSHCPRDWIVYLYPQS